MTNPGTVPDPNFDWGNVDVCAIFPRDTPVLTKEDVRSPKEARELNVSNPTFEFLEIWKKFFI